jgi:hypothetical protein
MIKPKVVEGCRVPKGWGEEIIIENNENYCGKILVFEPECKFSMHYHVVRQRPGQPHQLESLTYGRIFEVSTHHEDSDSYRVLPGDSQR